MQNLDDEETTKNKSIHIEIRYVTNHNAKSWYHTDHETTEKWGTWPMTMLKHDMIEINQELDR